MSKTIITLLTDFGVRDAYVASMKGVILGLNPAAVLVDLTHEVPPQDLRAGALVLAAAAPYFPPGTIHVAVVDPGVGSGRRALAVQAGGQYLVGPDNGLFSLLFSSCSDLQVAALENSRYFLPQVSATFHGRDIFAPVAAHLSLGVDLARFGPAVADPVTLEWPQPVFAEDSVRGEIIYVDHFGNLISNVPGAALASWARKGDIRLQLGDIQIRGLSRTYTDAAPGALLALVGSHGYLEIACARGNAALLSQVRIGEALIISPD